MEKTCKQCEHFIIMERAGVAHQFCVAEEPQQTPKVNCAFFESVQQSMHLTAFGAQLAWFLFGFILLLAMILVIIGGR